MIDGIVEILTNFVLWVTDKLHALVYEFIQELVAAVPANLQANFAAFVGYLEIANHWFPLGEMFVMLSALWTFQIAFSVIKVSVKLIPTVG